MVFEPRVVVSAQSEQKTTTNCNRFSISTPPYPCWTGSSVSEFKKEPVKYVAFGTAIILPFLVKRNVCQDCLTIARVYEDLKKAELADQANSQALAALQKEREAIQSKLADLDYQIQLAKKSCKTSVDFKKMLQESIKGLAQQARGTKRKPMVGPAL